MRELHPEHRAVRTNEVSDAREHLHLLVLPETEVLWTDPRLGKDRRRFRHHETRSADRELAKVDDVPLVGETIVARVLAHRRDTDAIAQRDAAKRERLEERHEASAM